ncbi:TrkH family potassium uptake protein [Rhodobacteraceae bacterium KMM 6894]|nr:TrkH family potassium uptake protein [Rhodobacteraceae bacterium KMM 6894]
MLDMRPVGYVIGLTLMALGFAMLFPLLVDLAEGREHWPAFAEASILTMLSGGLVALACRNGVGTGLTIQQTFLLTTGVWVVLPLFGALPFMLGQSDLSFTDAFFEAMSGLTTTGSTVMNGLDTLPKGLLLWRGLMQWLGGVGIIVVAMVFLPELRVGGMQLFKAEAFDTFGKILPRATEIASRISVVYLALTLMCVTAYLFAGLNVFDATVHALTTISTGGMANYDASFGALPASAEYVASVFMVLAALPFVRFVQMTAGTARPLLVDPQVRAFFGTIAVIVLFLTVWRVIQEAEVKEDTFREALFNTISIMTGTGFASVNYMTWGALPVAVIFFTGLIGGCAGSTSCSIKIFRYQLLFASIKVQIQRIRTPHGIFVPRYAGRPVPDDVLNSVMTLFVFFVVSMGVISVMLSLAGLDFITSVSGAAAALANIGPGLGDIIGPAGNFSTLNDTAKWILSAAMLVGRLELLAVYAIFTVNFWRT